MKIERVNHLGAAHQVIFTSEGGLVRQIYLRLPPIAGAPQWFKPTCGEGHEGFELVRDNQTAFDLEDIYAASPHARAEDESAKQFSAEQQIKDANESGAGAEFGL